MPCGRWDSSSNTTRDSETERLKGCEKVGPGQGGTWKGISALFVLKTAQVTELFVKAGVTRGSGENADKWGKGEASRTTQAWGVLKRRLNGHEKSRLPQRVCSVCDKTAYERYRHIKGGSRMTQNPRHLSWKNHIRYRKGEG